jgi:hypothetical protein
MYDDDEGGEYEYFETPEDLEEDSRESYAKKMIKSSKEQDGQFIRPDYSSNLSKESESEYQPPEKEEEPEEKPKVEEKKKEEYEL